MRVILVRVGRRPILMHLWYIWTLSFFVGIYAFEARTNALNAARSFYLVMSIGIIALAAHIILLLKGISNRARRIWMFEPIQVDKDVSPSLLSLAIVRATPLIALIVFFEVCVLRL